MTNASIFSVYNASAGSGKTFTLVKSFLTILLKSTDSNKFSRLLAITFTNKAVGEMKARIIHTLYAFSCYLPDAQKDPMLAQLVVETGLTTDEIARKSAAILEHILHNYAAFDILTIDTLTHRLLRTFSKDFKLSSNFEVSLDTTDMLSQAVDALIDKTGDDPAITKTLVSFALQKTQDDKSWNITYDLNTIAQLLIKENDRVAINQFSDKTLSDFNALEDALRKKIISLKAKIKETASKLLSLLQSQDLEKSHFTRGYFYSHVQQLATSPALVSYTAKWKQEFDSTALYTKTQKDDIKAIIDSLTPQLSSFFEDTKAWVFELLFNAALLKKITPLSVLHLIQQELATLKEEQNIVLISEFNNHIHTYLKDQPAPFIYERLGERYSNYFIDEFQDTSVLQWENLIPLIDNALSSASKDHIPNSLFIVGDAKQAIYRWRGGQAEQFIKLWQESSPFYASEIKRSSLATNYRSRDEIIHFNNTFFNHIAQYMEHPAYKELYATQTFQENNNRSGGQVSLLFLDLDSTTDKELLYAENVYNTIQDLHSQGYKGSDICILTRTNKDGASIATYLTDHNIKITSPDSLLIKNDPNCNFIIAILELIMYPNTSDITIQILDFLCTHLNIADQGSFSLQWINKPTVELLKSLEAYDIFFSIDQFEIYTLYEGVEYIIRAFNLDKSADAYVFGFLHNLHEFVNKNDTGLWGFLAYWEHKKDALAITTVPDEDAVQIMSIHKSKGLEFPVVIFPFADTPLHSARDEYHWFPLNSEDYQGFDHLMVDHKKELQNYNAVGQDLYTQRMQQQEFDAINILYVALTRAIDCLYIMAKTPTAKQMTTKPTAFNVLLADFLTAENRWDTAITNYTFGANKIPQSIHRDYIASNTAIPFITASRKDLNLQVAPTNTFGWNQTRNDAIHYGVLLHELLSNIYVIDDISLVIEEAVIAGKISWKQKEKIYHYLNTIVSHPQLSQFFNPDHDIYNERSILSSSNTILIPDRVEISKDGNAYLLDYKTGIATKKHHIQIKNYITALEQMDYKVVQYYLIYIKDNCVIELV